MSLSANIVSEFLTPFSQKPPINHLQGFTHFASRDVFQAQLDNFYRQVKNPLLVAVFGEIGNNAFDHNLGRWRDLSGLFFAQRDHWFCFGDRGQGVHSSLARVLPALRSDGEAVETAFTKQVSGRSPENRGNGLKFSASVIQSQSWQLYFQSGSGICTIEKGTMTFNESENLVYGSVAFIGT